MEPAEAGGPLYCQPEALKLKRVLWLFAAVVIGGMFLVACEARAEQESFMYVATPVPAGNIKVFPGNSSEPVCAGAGAEATPFITAYLTFDENGHQGKKEYVLLNPEGTFEKTVNVPASRAGEWTEDVPGDCLIIYVPDHAMSLTITQKMFIDPSGALKGVFPEGSIANFVDAATFQEIKEVAEATRSFVGLSRKTPRYMKCTGYLLTPLLLITNFHCVKTQDEADATKFLIGFKTRTVFTQEQKGAEMIVANDDLDYSILKLRIAGQVPPGKLPWSTGTLELDQGFLIIQIPKGETLVIAKNYNECHVMMVELRGRGASKRDFAYKCDTNPGSSGGIVVAHDERKCPRVIGLHRKSVEWFGPDDLNQAVDIRAIYEDLIQLTSDQKLNENKARAVRELVQKIRFSQCG